MPRHDAHLQIKIILLIGITTTSIPKIFTLENDDNQNQRYDYIDVAKEMSNARNKGHTTRIFTTENELDETFWLKYLGEDFRHAVHLQVDINNNIIPVGSIKPPTLPTLNYNPNEEKRKRVVRQPVQDDFKQLPVENLYHHDHNEYPTETPEMFDVNPIAHNTTTLPSATPTASPDSQNTQLQLNKNTPSKHKDKLHLHNSKCKQKIVQAKLSRNFKALDEPIVVDLPDVDNTVHHINEELMPVIVQIPPVIYHQKAELYPEHKPNLKFFLYKNQLYTENTPNPPHRNNNMGYYNKHIQQNTPLHQKQNRYAKHSHHLRLAPFQTKPQHKQQQQQLLQRAVYPTHHQIKQPYFQHTHSPPSHLPSHTISLPKRTFGSFSPKPPRRSN